MKRMIRKKLLLLLCIVCAMSSIAQTYISPISITLPANPPANTAEWATAMPTILINAQAKLVNGHIPGFIVDSRILVTIKRDGRKICGSYTPRSAPITMFGSTIKRWGGNTALSLLGTDCTLQPGTYEFCVQFYGDTSSSSNTLLGEACRSFTIADKKQERFSPPQAVMPADGKIFTEKESNTTLTFRWTSIIPKPVDKVVYTVRVYEVANGQSTTEAIKNGYPIYEKQVVDQTQLVNGTVVIIWAKAQSKNSKMAWQVEAKGEQGRTYGMSEPSVFSLSSGGCHTVYDAKIESIRCIDYNHVAVCAKIICIQSGYGPNPGYSVYPTQVNVAKLIAMPSNTIVGSNTTLGTVNQGNSLSVCFSSAAIPAGTTQLNVKFETKTVDPNHNCTGEANADTTMPNCACKPCDLNNVSAVNKAIGYTNLNNQNTLRIRNTISASPSNVTKIEADLVLVRVTPTSNACTQCNKQNSEQGNFTGGNQITNGNVSYWQQSGTAFRKGENSNPNISRSVEFITNTAAGANISAGIDIDHYIGVAPPNCCGDEVEVWIRYTVWDTNCKVCDKLVKKTISRVGECGTK